ncbi:MAG: preprotein translocase subunit SecA [Lentimonas sp.]|jgi:preprotein translocase subunit SecA
MAKSAPIRPELRASEPSRFAAPRNEARRTEIRDVELVLGGLDGWVYDQAGRWKSRDVKSDRLWEQAGAIERVLTGLGDLPERQLRADLRAMQGQVRRHGLSWSEQVGLALPLVAEAARRSLGLTAYRTQLMGALGIGSGSLVEMATGEGKTLTIALAAAIAGFTGKPCHVITANDYLASRDAAELSRFYEYCGLVVASISADFEGPQRREAYLADVVYCTGKELVADYLRDQIALGPLAESKRRAMTYLLRRRRWRDQLVLRGLSIAIVDEADNQLIDEAVTPLIISRKQESESMRETCRSIERCASTLLPGEHYDVNDRFKEIRLLPCGRELVEEWCAERRGLLSAPDWVSDLVLQSLQARHFFLRDKQYVMVDGKVVIVDEFTGRPMPGRSWRLGLHQAVEAKEGCEVSAPSETLARLSFQNFYRYFDHLSGITGTARESWCEFWRIYDLPFVKVPYHKPNVRRDERAAYFVSENEKWDAVVEEVLYYNRLGRPVLIGTRSVDASEHLGRLLAEWSLDCKILNAVRHDQEADIILRAGDDAAITIATNMAGRGSDIRISKAVEALGGLHVILTEGHESGRVDRQLRGRAGRQGEQGSSRLFASFEDELFQRHLNRGGRSITQKWIDWALPGRGLLLRLGFYFAQRRAERRSQRQRFVLMKQDQEIAKSVIGGGAKSPD